jgi:methylenetetrahydrofolate reductase (NADPH)
VPRQDKIIAKKDRWLIMCRPEYKNTGRKMKINELYKDKFVISFEIFPPKTPLGETNLWNELKILSAYHPDFVSVTYGAGGSTRDKTLEIARKIRDVYNIIPLVHFTCVGAGRKEIRAYLEEVKARGIENILALRGDPPMGETSFRPHPDGFNYANELVQFIREINGFTIAVAGYPEGHIEAPDKETDLLNLKKKIDAGADFVITQRYYDNNDYYDFVNRARQAGINVPIIPGIMPITNLAQIARTTSQCGASIPDELMKVLQSCGSDNNTCEAGLDYSVRQCLELKSWGVPGLHIYPMNKSMAVTSIMKELGLDPADTSR